MKTRCTSGRWIWRRTSTRWVVGMEIDGGILRCRGREGERETGRRGKKETREVREKKSEAGSGRRCNDFSLCHSQCFHTYFV